MSENKRFRVFKYSDSKECGVSDDVTDCDFGRFDYFEAELLCDILNELNDENGQLKSDNNRLVNETAKIIAEHQRKVFELIDEKIKEYSYKEKFYKHKGKDREASVFNLYCFCLNNLKKELSE